jgi:hypothetical protein
MPPPSAPHLDDSKKLCKEARGIRQALRITVAESKMAVARAHQVVARTKELKKSIPSAINT